MSDPTGLKRILIFDDDSDFRKLLLLRLKKMFDKVDLEEYDPIASGVPADDFNWAGYDVLLLDYYLCLHGVTGLDILHKNRKNPHFPATIMLTGAGNEEIAVHALKSGVSDYMRKEKLDKDALYKAIVKAFEEQKVKRTKINEATLHGQAFNKANFYQQLDKPNRDTKKRVLLIMQLDSHEQIAAAAGMIVRDNVVRHLAKQSFEVFRMGSCNPNITRYDESSIALLIDDPESQKTLEFNLQGLCKHLQQRPYKFNGKKYRFSVSIGVVSIAQIHEPAAVMTSMGKQAAIAASATRGENSYRFYEQLSAEERSPVAAVEKQAVVETTAPDEPDASTGEVDQAEPITQPYLKTAEETIVEPETAAETELKPAPEPEPEAAAETTTAKAEPESENKTTAPVEKAETEPVAEVIEATVTKPELEPKPAPEPKPEIEAKTIPPAAPAEKTSSPVETKPKQVSPAPVAKKPVAPPESDDSILADAALNIAALAIKRAFEEKRVVQNFQPLISFVADGADEFEAHSTSLQLFETDGSLIFEEEIFARVKDIPAFLKYIDRWMLREAIGRAVHSAITQFVFIMKISDPSLADTTLFNWLRHLLSGLEKSNPGKAITLEISAESCLAHRKPVEALTTFLRKSYGFRFMLAHVEDLETLKSLTEKTHFDFLKISPDMVKQLSQEASGDSEEGGTLLSMLKNKGTAIVVKDVEDATTLTEVISVGADFAMGEFIGEATTQLDDSTNVESFDIS